MKFEAIKKLLIFADGNQHQVENVALATNNAYDIRHRDINEICGYCKLHVRSLKEIQRN